MIEDNEKGLEEELKEKRNKLLEAYQQWYGQLTELLKTCPEFRDKKYTYSHPYYLHIPDDWCQSTYRILIVGEEGYGEKEFELSIEKAQEFNRKYLLSQIDPDQLDKNDRYKRSGSSFWRRIRSIDKLMKDNGFPYSITWTNLDMIHHSIKKGNCKLKQKERESLHSTPKKILSEEIDILRPTHVIYFGWYGISLEKELPDVFHSLYPNGLGDDSQWKDEKMAKFQENGIWHIFTYHPSWGYRQKRDDNGKSYEDKVLDQISETLTQGSSDVK